MIQFKARSYAKYHSWYFEIHTLWKIHIWTQNVKMWKWRRLGYAFFRLCCYTWDRICIHFFIRFNKTTLLWSKMISIWISCCHMSFVYTRANRYLCAICQRKFCVYLYICVFLFSYFFDQKFKRWGIYSTLPHLVICRTFLAVLLAKDMYVRTVVSFIKGDLQNQQWDEGVNM